MSKRTRNLDILATFLLIICAGAFTLLWTVTNNRSLKHNRTQVHLTVTVAEINTRPAPVPIVKPKIEQPQNQITGKKTCFTDETSRKQRCTTNQAPGIPLADRSLPLLLGVGPAKTSSTALFDSLGQHPEILLGNVSLAGHECCGSELYYFSRRFNSTDSAANLGAYFSLDTKQNARWVAEKTPEYSDHFLAPYRVRATLQPSALALVFTIRDPVDAHVSLYFYRMKRKNMKSSAQGFIEWSKNLLQAHHIYRKCVQTQLLAQKHKEPISTNMSPTWIGQQSLDEAVFEACRAPFFKPSDRLEGVGSLEYSQTLPRWHRVFNSIENTTSEDLVKDEINKFSATSSTGIDSSSSAIRPSKVPMMCVFHQDFINNPDKETQRVAQFIGLDPSKLKLKSGEDGGGNSNGGFEQSAEERVFAAEGAHDQPTALELWQHMKRLRGFFSGEMEFAQEFCRELKSEVSSTTR